MSEVWFNRLVMLFDLGGVLHREYAPQPYAADMLVVNPGYTVPEEWRAALKAGGKIFHVAEVRCEEKTSTNQEQIPDSNRSAQGVEDVTEEREKETAQIAGQIIGLDPAKEFATDKEKVAALVRLADRDDGPLPQGVGGDGAEYNTEAQPPDAGPVARGDGHGKGRRGPRKGREKVVPEKGGV